MWDATYNTMLDTIQAVKGKSDPIITPEVEELVGSDPPLLLGMSLQDIENGLHNGTIDIGMCGLLVTRERMERFDFTSPFYLASGLQAVTPTPKIPSVYQILHILSRVIDDRAQLLLLLLILAVYCFGVLIAFAESLSWGIKRSHFRKNILEGMCDGMWFAINVMSTVGLGEIYPLRFLGRILTTAWIWVSVALINVLLAAVVTNFLQLDLAPGTSPASTINAPTDLAAHRVAATAPSALAWLNRTAIAPSLASAFDSSALIRALLAGVADAAVDRPEVLAHLANRDPEFRGSLAPVGPVFDHEGVAIAVRRGGGGDGGGVRGAHPLLRFLSLASLRASRGPAEEVLRERWFGAPLVAAPPAAARARLLAETARRAGGSARAVLAACLCAWVGLCALSAFLRSPAHTLTLVQPLSPLPHPKHPPPTPPHSKKKF